ncbi:MAG: metallophosphoesterase [Deltaproteobacteria bacterium]|jgi:hypothetical protein|nr:metallophosphoesterase [Deltaproteobacteria bacterium]
MIWVIGDIHGMLDPLKRVLEAIRSHDGPEGPVERIIFIGDYIDHGPSSREVMDLILGLEYETVCLAGDHEDLALRFMRQDERRAGRNGLLWFEHGALDTYKSIYWHKNESEIINKAKLIYDESKSCNKNRHLNTYKNIKLPLKYEKFLKNLKYSHREVFMARGRELPFSFFHGLPRGDLTLGEQMAESHDDFTRLLDIWGEAGPGVAAKGEKGGGPGRHCPTGLGSSHLWNRDYVPGRLGRKDAFRGYGDGVVVHGHIPTVKYPSLYPPSGLRPRGLRGQFEAFPAEMCLPFLFSVSPGSGYQISGRERALKASHYGDFRVTFGYSCGDWPGVQAINIDTGAVHGGALTALGLSGRRLAHGEFTFLTAPTSAPQRGNSDRIMARTILVHDSGVTRK